MKIAIPVNEDNVNSEICMSFGRTPFFCIYDTDTKEKSFLDNSAAASAGGAGIKASNNLINEGVEIILTPRCGKNAVDVLDAGNVKIYKTINDNLDENINLYLEEKLEILKDGHPGFHGHN